MKKLIIALLTFLIYGVRLTDSSAMTVGLFVHYLMGSGESVTVHSPELLRLCEKEGVNSAYDTEYQNAVGNFFCRKDGTAWDLYDFKYYKIYPFTDVPSCITEQFIIDGTSVNIDVASMGRCFVWKGYGKPFHVEIKQ